MTSETKNIFIDQDSPAEDNETTESYTDPSIIENACPQCSAFRANADRAWDVLREFQTANEENKKFKNEIHQLESQLKESRDYISALRQQQQDYDKIIKEKDLKISLSEEKIVNLEDQYSRVLRAGRQHQHDSDKIIKEKDLKIKNADERIATLEFQYNRLVKAEQQKQQDFDNLIKEKDLKIASCNEKIADLECQSSQSNYQQQNFDDLIGTNDLSVNIYLDNVDNFENQKEDRSNEVTENGDLNEQVSVVDKELEPETLQNQKEDHNNAVTEKNLVISEDANDVNRNEDVDVGQVLEPKALHNDPTASLEIDDDDLSLDHHESSCRQHQNDSDKIIKEPESSHTDPTDSLEIDDDDNLSLELPLSPPKKAAVSKALSIDEIFNSSFFLEHAKNKLLDNLGPFDLLLPSPAPKSPASKSPARKKNFQGSQEFRKVKENDEPQISTTPTAPPQFSIQLTDENSKLQIFNISKKYKIDKKQAALLYSQAKRDDNRKRRLEPSDDENDGGESIATSETVKSEKAPRHLLPWVPHRPVVRTQTRSVLSYEDHKRYVGIIVNELQSVPKYRFEHNKTEIQALDQKLEDERNFYIKSALQSAKQFKAFHFDPGQLKIFNEHYHEMIKLYIGQRVFQGVLSSIPWPRTQILQDSQASQSPHIRTTKILSPGLAPKTQIPEIKRKFIFSNKPVRQMLCDRLKDKQPIDEDKQVVDFALFNGVHVSMDASTLRHLLSAPWSQRNQTYACKLKITSRVFSGKLCKICIISPPLIASRIHKTAIPRAFAKWGLKAFLFGNDPSFADSAPINQPKDTCQSLLDDLGLGNVGKVDTKNSRKRYSIISFDDPKLEISPQEQHQVLIRTNLHANEERKDGQLQQISLTARVEFLPEIGAEKLSNEEQIWNLLTGLLKGSEEHINFRLKVERESVVLQYDRRLPTKISQLSVEAKAILAGRINRVKTLLKELPKLSVGEYLLMPDVDNEQLQIIKQQTAPEEISVQQSTSFDNVYEEDKSNLWEEPIRSRTVGPRSLEKNVYYDAQWFDRLLQSKIISSQNELFDYWNGIDPHYPLQWHVVKSQIPGALYPKRN
uniref:Little elongation complex subunit 2 C-terminal domain-containing protein n=1 Tax=Meloidogyne enterolobii TaxID=390850 RepID=A0A6V7WE03_MELEN|nr:unnamed protein product [Meloidogyne enterolobii]